MSGFSGLEVSNLESVASPALLVWPERVRANLGRMLDLVGGDPSRLRPHVKTHKMEAVVRLQIEAGIARFKCATIAEMEMCLRSGARDVLLAYPVVGPNQARLVRLAAMYPEAEIHFIADEVAAVNAIDELCRAAEVEVGVFIDFDSGMQRTGTDSFERCVMLARALENSDCLYLAGLHGYDGHIRETTVAERERDWSAGVDRLLAAMRALEQMEYKIETVVVGGSPTFPFHAANPAWQCSPGTILFWDGGYGGLFPDLPFEVAAAVLTRIVSKPGTNRLCLDLGHKAIASEGPLDKRVQLFGFEGAKPVMHSEEHLVVEVEDRDRFSVGDALLGIPHHICPTVALHQEAVLVRDGRATGETWPVTARNRRITV